MNIKLYNTVSPSNKLNKTLNLVADITGESNISIDEHNCVFILSKGHLIGVQGSNYMYCTDTNKYYYIENYEVINQTVRIQCKVDVLMTYKTQILNNTCTISRNENIANAYMYDENYKLLSYKNIVTKKFPVSLNNDTIILMTVG